MRFFRFIGWLTFFLLMFSIFSILFEFGSSGFVGGIKGHWNRLTGTSTSAAPAPPALPGSVPAQGDRLQPAAAPAPVEGGKGDGQEPKASAP